MRTRIHFLTLPFIGAFAVLAACQSVAAPTPAVLEAGDVASRAHLKTAIAAAMGKSRVELGAGDLTVSPEIIVLPPRLGPQETHSLAVPTYFDLAVRDGVCVIIRRETGDIFTALDVTCRAVEN